VRRSQASPWLTAGGRRRCGDDDRPPFERSVAARDSRGRGSLVRRYLPLARRAARQYAGPREPFDDRFQVACLGLVHALDRFDPRREVPFGSYARPTIRGELKRHFRDRVWECGSASGAGAQAARRQSRGRACNDHAPATNRARDRRTHRRGGRACPRGLAGPARTTRARSGPPDGGAQHPGAPLAADAVSDVAAPAGITQATPALVTQQAPVLRRRHARLGRPERASDA
jgi:RNA polymerase sigma factor (sigma-70 family)